MELSPEIIVLLFFVAAIAGWVDVIAGGGGLLTIPALILVGVPPAAAVATNKLQGSFGTAIASVYFVRKGAVDLTKIKLPICMTLLGSLAGSWFILQIDATALALFLPVLLVATGLYFLLAPNIDNQQRKQKIPLIAFALIIAPLLGFYDGFFGPGTGSFMALALVLCCGHSLPLATAHAKILNFTSNISSLAYFIIYGDIIWLAGLAMIAGQILGAVAGAKLVLKNGSALIKPVIVIVCFAMSINILWKYYAS